MPISQNQLTQTGFTGSGTSVSATFASNCNPGSTIIAVFAVASASGTLKVSDGANGSYDLAAFTTGAGLSIGIWFFTNQQSSTALTVTGTFNTTVSNLRLIASEWNGIDQTAPIFFPLDQGLGVGGSSSTPSAGTLATLAEAGELTVAGAVTTAGVTWTAGSGWALDPQLTGTRAITQESQIVSGTTGPTANFSMSSNLAWAAVTAAFRSQKTRKVISLSGSTFSAPSDWPGIADRVDLVGGGAAGRQANGSTHEGLGGGAGAYTFAYNIAMSQGTAIQVGNGGTSNAQNGTGSWVVSTSTAFADFGRGPGTATAGQGGSVANCIPVGNASAGGTGGTYANNATAGATGGGGAGGYYGPGSNGGTQNATGTTGGTGGGGADGGTAGANQTASTGGGTTGGNGGSASGAVNFTGGAGGTTPTGGGTNGTANNGTGAGGGGGGASDGSGNGGGGGPGGGGAEWSLFGGGLVGCGGGGGGTGQQNSGSGPPFAGNGGLYGGGGGGGGNGTYAAFGSGAQGLIVVTYTPMSGPPPTLLPTILM